MFVINSLNINAFKNGMGDKPAFFSAVRAELPDVVYLQETGMPEDRFPNYVRLEGYHLESAFDPLGIGTTGVSILSRQKPAAVRRSVCDAITEHAECRGRFIAATWPAIAVASIYAPNPDAPNGKANQAQFFSCLVSFMLKHSQQAYVIAGDFNTILGNGDRPSTKSSPWANARNRAILLQAIESGWFDTFRRIHGQAVRRVTAWHSQSAFESAGYGIDFQLASPATRNRLVDAAILRPETYMKQFSDHAATKSTYELEKL